MGLATIIGLVLGLGAVVASLFMEGGDLAKFSSPSAALIVFGGTLGATMISNQLGTVTQLPSLILKAIMEKGPGIAPSEVVGLFVGLAERARREGLLSLETEAGGIKDPFIRKGMLLVVDGIDPEVVRAVQDVDIDAMEQRHQKGYGMLEAMGGFAPTMGIIGTVMGLVNVLSNLDDPSHLGEAIAVAFIATFYGVASANLLWLPLASKLKALSKAEVWLREVAREGILAVQAGDNPRIVREKLEAFLSGAQRDGKDSKTATSGQEGRTGDEAMATAGSQ
ncbi:MAG: flagellar motor protein [Chloroflexi bacterium]|nr:flagellar motor protein [Chloroflexota bacterium]